MSLPKVLVVDDHPMNRKLATMLLRNAGYRHDEAESGEQALERLAGGDFGVVLLDVSMPGISGEEVCRRIRADERLRGFVHRGGVEGRGDPPGVAFLEYRRRAAIDDPVQVAALGG